jgi:ceramide glucosyltransferase
MSALALCAQIGLSLSVAAYAAAAVALLRARRHARGEPLTGWEPGVSILKPLRGVDDDLAANLESFYRLDYGAYEMIFSFASAEDPAYAIARRIADRHPEVQSLFVFDAREPGGNAKVNRLAAGLRLARHRLVLFADGNVRVRPDFLRRAVSWFADPAVGLVSHLFRASGAVSFGSRVESLYLNGCLQGGTALLAGLLRMPCVVGKSILVSRVALEAIGGIGVLREFLAEDFLMGSRVRRAGYRVVLSGDFLDTAEVRKSVAAAWNRHRRWAIMRRRLAGPLYAGELLTSALPWGALAMAGSSPRGAAVAGLLLALRYAGEIALAARIGRPLSLTDAALLPVRDLAAAALFWAGLTGKWVAWRGRPLRIGRETLILDRPV